MKRFIHILPLSFMFGTCVVASLIMSGCERQQADFPSKELKPDSRYQTNVQFKTLGITVALPANTWLREDKPVESTEEHGRALAAEIGFSGKTKLTNPALRGRHWPVTFRDGKKCSFIWVSTDPDVRRLKASLEHERFHCLFRQMPEEVQLLTKRIRALGFDVDLSAHDEEFAATIVEIVSKHQQGASLDRLSGDGLTNPVVRLLRASRPADETRKIKTTQK